MVKHISTVLRLDRVDSPVSDGRMFTPAQLRAARALLDWTRADLAAKAGVALLTIQMFERGASDPRQSTLLALRSALSKEGVMFLDESDAHGPGVAFSASQRRKSK